MGPGREYPDEPPLLRAPVSTDSSRRLGIRRWTAFDGCERIWRRDVAHRWLESGEMRGGEGRSERR